MLNKGLQMSLWGVFMPKMDRSSMIYMSEPFFLFICAAPLCGAGPINPNQTNKRKYKSLHRVGPHNIDVLSVMFGCLLGDAYAEKRSDSTRICFQQESNNVEYLRGLHKFFAERLYTNPSKPVLQKRIGPKGSTRFVCRFKTWSFQSLNWLHDTFYITENGVKCKRVPSLEHLNTFCTPIARAVWIMDDGTKSGKGLTLATNSFPEKDVQVRSLFLKTKYGLQNRVNRCGKENQYVIYIWAESMPTRISVVRLYMIEGMLYKLGI